MRNLSWCRALSIVLVVLFVSACAAGRIVPLDSRTKQLDQSLPSGLQMSDIRSCLRTAAIRTGWEIVSAEGDETMQLNLDVRDHNASVDVKLEGDRLQATYRDSTNLLYDADGSISERTSRGAYSTVNEYEGPVIHRNYNRWIDHLLSGMAREVLAQNGQCS